MNDVNISLNRLLIGATNGQAVYQLGLMSNRHGLIAGATGTGKTVTLQILAEGFSRMGVPVFAADIKGDLSGIATAGKPHKKIDERLAQIPVENFQLQGNPTLFWDIFGKAGHPIRTTISEMGPLLLSNLLALNDTQSGILYAAFKLADDEGLLLLDLEDLRSLLNWMAENSSTLSAEYGNITKASVAAIQRSLLVLEQQGAEQFLGEPALDLSDLMRTDFGGKGVISLFDATKLAQHSPHLYSGFLLWLLAELFEQLPECGDQQKPKLAFFFDEAHLLFNDAPKALIDKIEQVVRLIRSKGVGVYFVTQNPADVPDNILGQLGLRIQHALRAYTPKDRKAIKAVAANFRPNRKLDTEQTVTELGVGEALVSALDEKGSPTPVERVLIRPPESRIGPLDDAERNKFLSHSPVGTRYDEAINRQSAHECLLERAKQKELEQADAAAKQQPAKASRRQGTGEAFIKSAARAIGSQFGRQIVRGILGSLFGKNR